MKLGEFISNFINNNSLIRLVYKDQHGYRTVLDNWDDVSMDWQVLKGEGKYKDYINYDVIGIKDILVTGHYSEAINIIITNEEI